MDYRFMVLAAVVANLWTDSRKKQWSPEDFRKFFDFEGALDEHEEAEESKPVSVVDKVKTFFGMLVSASKEAPPPTPPQIQKANSERGESETQNSEQ
ncbi:hypothetical protein FBQ81_03200 [Chloroflexi bacterium CFX6]|nr:hypothetical protein [Chloroflexi bacterium CFX6]